jgi:hypothetical protein
MDMCWFVAISRIEEEAIGPGAKRGRHGRTDNARSSFGQNCSTVARGCAATLRATWA